VESVAKRLKFCIYPGLLNMQSYYHIPGCPVEAKFITASKVLARRIMKAKRHPGGRRIQGLRSVTACARKEIYSQTSMGRRLTRITEESVFTYNGNVPRYLRTRMTVTGSSRSSLTAGSSM
jgi:hypothetical protein